MKKIILILLVLLILWKPIQIISMRSDAFFSRTYNARYSELKRLYYSSQYTVKKDPVIVTDEAIESFLAGAFLKGANPIMFIHDHPPLGKYIIGLSIFIFDNENTIIIPLYLLSILCVFLIGKETLKNTLAALVPTALFSNEPLMYSKLLITPVPELVQLPFILFSIYFFVRFTQGKHIYRWAILASLSLGSVISIRFFILGVVLLFSQFAFLILKRNVKLMTTYIFFLPFSLFVLEASYLKTIIASGSVVKPIAVQKYILSYHSSKFTQLFTVWDLLLFNRWHTWWGDRSIATDPNWLITWPLSVISSVILSILGIIRKIKLLDSEMILLLWVFSYGFMLSFGYSSVRYFLPLIPCFYILAISLLFRIKSIQKIMK